MDARSGDPVVAAVLDEARADADTVGLLLAGSRGAGQADAESDYDFVWVLSDLAYQDRAERGGPWDVARRVAGHKIELSFASPAVLRELAERPSWRNPDYATAVVLLDRSGELGRLVEAVVAIPAERIRRDAAAGYDAYLNGFYRSVKAWRRGDELGARLQAAESVVYLVRTLFALRGRRAPHHDRLVRQLAAADGLGWPPGDLAPRLLELVRTADPVRQQALEAEVEALMRAHGYGDVLDAWGGELDRVRAGRGA